MSTYKVLLLLILTTLISPSLTDGFGVNLIKVPNEERSQVICTIALLRKYFHSGEPLSGSLLSMSITSALIHVQQSLLHAIHTDNTYPWTVVVKDTRHETPITSPMLVLHEKPQCYFVIIENLEDEDLEDIFEDWRTTINWNPLAQFVVYLASVEETDEEMTELMIEILLNFMNIKIYNVNIIGQNEENGFYYGKTVFPYHPDNNCGNRVIAIETLDICDYQGTEQNDEGDEAYDEDEEGTEDYDDNEEGTDDNEEGASDNEEGASDNEEGANDNEEGGNGNEEDANDNEEDSDDNTEVEADNENGGDDNAEGEGDNAEGEGDDAEGVNGNEKDADDNDKSTDDDEKSGDENAGGGNDNEKVGDDNKEGADDNEEGGNDNEDGANDNGEDSDDNTEVEDDNEKGGDDNAEGESDNAEGVNGNEKDADDNDKSTDDDEKGGDENAGGGNDNEKVADDNKEGADDNEKGGDNNAEGSNGNEEDGDDIAEGEEDTAVGNEKEDNDYEEDTHDYKKGADDNGEGEDENREVVDDNKDGTDNNEDGIVDSKESPSGNEGGEDENVAEKDSNEDKEDESNDTKDADNDQDDENESAHDFENPNVNVDNTEGHKDTIKSHDNENTSRDETENSINNNSNQDGQTVKNENEEKSKVTSEERMDDKDTNLDDYNSSIDIDNVEIPSGNLEQNYDNNGAQNKNFKAKTTKRKDKNKSKRMKRQMTTTEDEENNATETAGKIYLEELYRGLFLDKFPKDLSGCPLVAAYRPWEPYIFNEDYVKNEENYDDTEYTEVSNSDDEYGGSVSDKDEKVLGLKLTGIEYKMVQTIAERLHISIDIQVENKNLFHLYQQLIDGDIEMVVGGIDEDPSISQYVSSTIPYHQDDLTWCVAKAKQTYNFFNFMASFSMAAWALIFTFVVVTALTIVFIQKTLKIKISNLDGFFTATSRIYGILFSQAIQLKRLPSTLKICLGTAFFMSLMFSNIYHSFLISTLTTPKNSYQISHLAEIHSHRMSIMGSVENVRHLNKDGEIFKYIREKFQMCYNIEECLIRAANDDRIAVAVSRQHSFYNPRIPREQLYCFDRDENIYVYLVTLLLPKKFHLLHKINPIIQHVIESGHMQKWARDLDMKRKIKEEVQRVREEPVKRLTLAEVGGSFSFTAILLLLAFLVFVTECWVHWMVTKRRTRLKLAKMLHKKFK